MKFPCPVRKCYVFKTGLSVNLRLTKVDKSPSKSCRPDQAVLSRILLWLKCIPYLATINGTKFEEENELQSAVESYFYLHDKNFF
ncbi:hypothetical protein M514_05845 [Trichuris suis]|uniref:Uncharacterized protein n=1 Tax=Trichuris suis TaxID=68888 RepID=A0A085M818_9BILA|nr:hypothetical protein M513_05845 [Trichuris suis]KFD61161.1 hypothetical protein M514_05845 [Trichuris suis]